MVMENVEGFEEVFGQAEVQLESSSAQSALWVHPFLFSMAALGPHCLRLCVSDFYSHSWRSDFSIQQLLELRDDVGIGGSWNNFLSYVRAALSSSNVKLMLREQANAVCNVAASARVVAQKSKGTPRLSLPLTQLEGSDVEDARGSFSLGMFQAYNKMSSALISEKAQVNLLRAALAAEQAKVERLEEQNDASSLSFTGRKKLKKIHSSQLPFAASVSQQVNVPSSQLEMQDVQLTSLAAAPAGTLRESKEMPAPKPPGTKTKVHVAPASRRAQRRGTAITDETDI